MASTTLYRHHSSEFRGASSDEGNRRTASLPIVVPPSRQNSFGIRTPGLAKTKPDSRSSIDSSSRENSFSEGRKEWSNGSKFDSSRRFSERVTKCLNCQFAVYCPKPQVDPNFCSKDCATCFYWPSSSDPLTPLTNFQEQNVRLML